MAITVAEAREWLKVAPAALSDSLLETIINAETAAQAERCIIPEVGNPPDDLRMALLYRVARAAARRGVPLGVVTGLGDGGVGSVRPAAVDPDIKRLEAPHRRLPYG